MRWSDSPGTYEPDNTQQGASTQLTDTTTTVSAPKLIIGTKGPNVYFADGDYCHGGSLRGVYYSADLDGLGFFLRSLGMPVFFKGGPKRGVTKIVCGRSLQILNPYSAWLVSSDTPIAETMSMIGEIAGLLGSDFRASAASTASWMLGDTGRLRDAEHRRVYKSYRGGVQWSLPGWYRPAYTYDITEAYGWALFDKRLPVASSWRDGSRYTITGSTIVDVDVVFIKGTPRFAAPDSADHIRLNYCDTREPFFAEPQRRRMVLWADELSLLDPWIGSLRIRSTMSCSMSYRIADKFGTLPKWVRKRLSNVAYGAMAANVTDWWGIPAVSRAAADDIFVYEMLLPQRRRIEKIKQKNPEYKPLYGYGATMQQHGNAWWVTKTRPMVVNRFDIASRITSQVRQRILEAWWQCHHAGGAVVHIYVDGLISQSPALSTGNKRGDWRTVETMPWVSVGLPGNYAWVAGVHSISGNPVSDMFPDAIYHEGNQEVWCGGVEVDGNRAFMTNVKYMGSYAYLPVGGDGAMDNSPVALTKGLMKEELWQSSMFCQAFSPSPPYDRERDEEDTNDEDLVITTV